MGKGGDNFEKCLFFFNFRMGHSIFYPCPPMEGDLIEGVWTKNGIAQWADFGFSRNIGVLTLVYKCFFLWDFSWIPFMTLHLEETQVVYSS